MAERNKKITGNKQNLYHDDVSSPTHVLVIGTPSTGKELWLENNKDKMPPNPIDIDPSRDPGEWYSHEREVKYARKERWISGDLEERNDFTVHTSTFPSRFQRHRAVTACLLYYIIAPFPLRSATRS